MWSSALATEAAVSRQGPLTWSRSVRRKPDALQCPIVLCGWRGKASVRTFVPRNERLHYLRMMGLEVPAGKKRESAGGAPGAGAASPAEPEDGVDAASPAEPEDRAGAEQEAGLDASSGGDPAGAGLPR